MIESYQLEFDSGNITAIELRRRVCKENRKLRMIVLKQQRAAKTKFGNSMNAKMSGLKRKRGNAPNNETESVMETNVEVLNTETKLLLETTVDISNNEIESMLETNVDVSNNEKKIRVGNKCADYYVRKKSKLKLTPSEICNMDLELLNFGVPSYHCKHYGAIMWYEEDTIKSRHITSPVFSLCCMDEKIELPLLKELPELLKELLDVNSGSKGKIFKNKIRIYNSIFSFTMGGNIDTDINRNTSPYVFKLCGQNYHHIGTLLPPAGKKPTFAQLYIYDTQCEISHRLNCMRRQATYNTVDKELIGELKLMLDRNNELVKIFRFSRDYIESNNVTELHWQLKIHREKDGRQYNLPTAYEIAKIIVGDVGLSDVGNDIVYHSKNGLQRITNLHPSFMALSYPILFPYGEDGYRVGIKHRESGDRESSTRHKLIMRYFYPFRLQYRLNEGHTLMKSGRLLQQYIVDAYMAIEEERYHGYPDFFLHLHVIQKWPEIQYIQNAIGQCDEEGRVTAVCRVFEMKLLELMKEIKNDKYFGEIMTRGLPHAHVLIFLCAEYKNPSPSKIDSMRYVELPDKEKDPLAYAAVGNYNIHGPCGNLNTSSPCMGNGKCKKHFPKKFVNATTVDDKGYLAYRRRDTGAFIEKNRCQN
ncbi:uncharacterized protein LOC116137546 [Pistacia vera]|uniref:uncharacterized protein LOC116137546 n=1 Tax=Pistacia vera TaxID=55513 RepID=UPI0012635CE4|nr:uncharacterized protein LOC116137546 [Pistacia vera]